MVDAAFYTEDLDGDDLVVDIGLATEALARVLAPLRYQNLDTVETYKGRKTTTEFLAREIFRGLGAEIAAGRLGPGSGRVRGCA